MHFSKGIFKGILRKTFPSLVITIPKRFTQKYERTNLIPILATDCISCGTDFISCGDSMSPLSHRTFLQKKVSKRNGLFA